MDLHPHEIKVLKALKKASSPKELSAACGLPLDAVLRAGSWLKTKGLIAVDEKEGEEVTLTKEGAVYAEDGLPERQLINRIRKDGIRLEELKANADASVFGIGFGWLRRKGQVEVKDGFVKVLSLGKSADEEVLELLKGGPVLAESLTKELSAGLGLLKSRKSVVASKETKDIMFKPTEEGSRLAPGLKEDDSISQLTPELIVSGAWKGRRFRAYDTKVYVRPDSPVKRHPLRRQINKVRRIFTGMGFQEIRGPLVESAFWNFDALFQPQDHPARDMHDTFYLKNPDKIDIEGYGRFKDKIKASHEDGGGSGSTGWGYGWSEEVSKKTLLRTHTTAVSARFLGKVRREDLPVKVFSIGKVFRNEAVDYKHLPEFYQVEGIVVAPSVNFTNLLGILRQFYNEMGFDKVRFRPGYFPYTEMSVEPEVYMESKNAWIELGGAGIFRPEVVKPLLGFDCPVLAWGLGLDRIVTLSLGMQDIRDLYMSDVEWLKAN
ncbi:MAG: phenylalanine--tRNA ligase subunit alpha [Candidatus Altiarchaeota archaeon]